MTKLNKLLTTTAVAALLGVGLAVPQEAFAAGSKDPSVPASMKVSNPCAAKKPDAAPQKAANPCAPKEKNYGIVIPTATN